MTPEHDPESAARRGPNDTGGVSMDEVNALLEKIHRELDCSPRLRTSCRNGDPACWEWTATYRRRLRLLGYARDFGKASVSGRTLAECLRHVLEAEEKFDADEAKRLTTREETTRHAQ